MLTKNLRKTRDARQSYMIFGALIFAAWGALIVWQNSAFVELLGHEALADHHISFAGHLSAFLLSWLLMTVAMMLPVNLPVLIEMQQTRGGTRGSAAQIVVGYLIPWVLFGLLAFLGDSTLHEMTEPGAPLAGVSNFIAPAIVLATGVYQLTNYKRGFTERCKASMNTGFTDPDPRAGGDVKHGFRLGINCMGSCWSLMLLMFALGHHRLDWMLIISGIAAAERLTPWGTRLARWVGVGLILWGVYQVIAIV